MTTKSIYIVTKLYFFWMNVQKVERLTPVTLIAGYASWNELGILIARFLSHCIL